MNNYNSNIYEYDQLGRYYLIHPLDQTKQINSYRNIVPVFTSPSHYPSSIPISSSSKADLEFNGANSNKRKRSTHINITGSLPLVLKKPPPKQLENHTNKRACTTSRDSKQKKSECSLKQLETNDGIETEEQEEKIRAKNLERNRLAGKMLPYICSFT
ncbi:unnamed protein product [Mucor hiemalis]